MSKDVSPMLSFWWEVHNYQYFIQNHGGKVGDMMLFGWESNTIKYTVEVSRAWGGTLELRGRFPTLCMKHWLLCAMLSVAMGQCGRMITRTPYLKPNLRNLAQNLNFIIHTSTMVNHTTNNYSHSLFRVYSKWIALLINATSANFL